MTPSLIDIFWVLISASLVFLMQAGFLCLEAGATRSKNNINVVIKNISDFGISVLCFWLFGYALMFGQSHFGWVGTTAWAPDVGQGATWLVVFFLFQAMFCSTAVTIVSGAVAERMRFSSYLAIAVLVSGFIYPIFGHWTWNGLNMGESTGWLGQLGFVDFAGSTVVHSVGGWVALAATILVGPRIGRFSHKRRQQLMVGYDFPMSLLGTLLLWFGWFGFNGGSVLALNEQVPGIIMNTVMAGAAGLATPILLSILQRQQLRVSAVVNGPLAGLVAITAGCHAVTTRDAILIGAIGSLCMLWAEAQLQRWQIDDVVGAIPVHLAAGLWGTLAVALFGDLSVLNTGLSRMAQLGAQLTGVVMASLWAFGVTFLLLWFINRQWPLRVRHRDEHIGLNVAEHGAASDLVDFFTVMRRQERTGDLRLRAPVEPFTPVGQIAARYNRVIGSLQQALARTDAIVESAIEVILTVSRRDLRIQSVNPAVRKMFGLAEGQLEDQPLDTLIRVESLATCSLNGREHEATAQSTDIDLGYLLKIASEDGTPYELAGRRRSGGTFPVEVTVAALKSQPEDSYTLIIRDITLRKQAEAAIQRAEAKDLEARRLEKTLAELQAAQLQLVHSEKMSSLGQLVAGVAHEINNPVSFIHGNLTYVDEYVEELLALINLYLSDPDIGQSEAIRQQIKAMDIHYLAEDLPQILKSMRGGTERITEIVRSLKDFSHQGSAQRKRVDLHKGLDSTLTILGNKLKARPDRPAIKVVRDYGDLPLVECFPGQLNQVFMNLLTNAIDAIDEKWNAQQSQVGAAPPQWTPQIILRTERVEGDRLRLHFTDNGTGIPEHVKRRIMDPFFTTKPVGQGTGLGMSISYQIIVERHHGQLNCLSTPGQGTRFLIELPIETMPAAVTESRPSKRSR
ncbi:MAG: ammonium transporter [Leptolyngbya sp. SIOISBB]|nr:ammonium transporter [Leptolyngbya sp. SIOISBB]